MKSTILRCRTAYLVISIFCIGINYSDAQDGKPLKTKAYRRFEQAQDSLRLALAAGDSMDIAEWHYILGKRYMNLSNYIKARQHVSQAISIWERRGPSEKIARGYTRLFECELMEKNETNLAKAVLYADKILLNSRQAKTHFGMMNAYNARAGLHSYVSRQGKTCAGLPFSPSQDSAIYYQIKALEIAKALRKPLDIALGYDLLGDRLADKGHIEQGIHFEKLAIKLYKKIGYPESTIEPTAQIGFRYVDLKNLRYAKRWLDQSKHLADSLHWGGHTYHAFLAQALARYYAGIGQPTKALAYQKEEYEQRLQGEQSYRKAAIDGIALSQENDHKEYLLGIQKQKIASQQQQAKLQSWLIFLSVLLLVLATIVAVLSRRLSKKYKMESRKNENLFLEQGHRIKNNLARISNILQLQLGSLKEPAAAKALAESVGRVEAMSFIHKRLYGKVQSADIEIGDYIQDLIENVLLSYSLEDTIVNYEMDHVMLDVDKAISLGLIVNELSTNACKYALNRNPVPQLTVICYEKGADLYFSFQDNGPGFELSPSKKSFGLELIQIWVDNLKASSSFTFAGGTCFSLSFKKYRVPQLAHHLENRI